MYIDQKLTIRHTPKRPKKRCADNWPMFVRKTVGENLEDVLVETGYVLIEEKEAKKKVQTVMPVILM